LHNLSSEDGFHTASRTSSRRVLEFYKLDMYRWTMLDPETVELRRSRTQESRDRLWLAPWLRGRPATVPSL